MLFHDKQRTSRKILSVTLLANSVSCTDGDRPASAISSKGWNSWETVISLETDIGQGSGADNR